MKIRLLLLLICCLFVSPSYAVDNCVGPECAVGAFDDSGDPVVLIDPSKTVQIGDIEIDTLRPKTGDTILANNSGGYFYFTFDDYGTLTVPGYTNLTGIQTFSGTTTITGGLVLSGLSSLTMPAFKVISNNPKIEMDFLGKGNADDSAWGVMCTGTGATLECVESHSVTQGAGVTRDWLVATGYVGSLVDVCIGDPADGDAICIDETGALTFTGTGMNSMSASATGSVSNLGEFMLDTTDNQVLLHDGSATIVIPTKGFSCREHSVSSSYDEMIWVPDTAITVVAGWCRRHNDAGTEPTLEFANNVGGGNFSGTMTCETEGDALAETAITGGNVAAFVPLVGEITNSIASQHIIMCFRWTTDAT